jgi:DNA-binding transcriptional MocR family regulator
MAIGIDRAGSATLAEALVAAVERAIGERRLTPGARLPSIRRLAGEEGVSKSTVVEAYDRLVAAGRIVSRPGAGFYVAERRRVEAVDPGPMLERDIDPKWVMRSVLELPDDVMKPGCGWLPADWLEGSGLRRALRALARDPAARLFDYAHPLGFPPLRRLLALRAAERGIEVEPHRIVLTDSGSAAIDLAIRLLVGPGETVFVDDPCYYNFRAKLALYGARVIGIPFRIDGPDPEIFAAEAARHRPVAWVTNSGPHNPTGWRISAANAHRLLSIAAAHDISVVEDDVFGDFESRPAPRLAALDRLERVILLGSFSKTLSSATRCGYLMARADRVDRLVDLKLATTFVNDDLSAQLVHRMLADGSYRKHVEGLRRRLAEARDRIARELLAVGITPLVEGEAGLFLWAELPDGFDAVELARAGAAEGIVFAPGNVFSPSQSAGRHLRFNVAHSGHRRIWDFLAGHLARPAV